MRLPTGTGSMVQSTLKAAKITSRFLLMSVLLLASGDLFFRYLEPPEPSQKAQELLFSLYDTGYILPTIGFVFLVSALLLLFDRTVGLALVMIAPVSVNLILYHIFLNQLFNSAALWDSFLVVLNMVVAVLHYRRFRSLVCKECS